jgi:hypothetical protein
VTSDGAPIHAEWNVMGYTRLPHENGGRGSISQQSSVLVLSTKYVPDKMAYKAHVRDEYTILPSGRLVISARVWRTVAIPLPHHYVSIRRPDDGGQWS